MKLERHIKECAAPCAKGTSNKRRRSFPSPRSPLCGFIDPNQHCCDSPNRSWLSGPAKDLPALDIATENYTAAVEQRTSIDFNDSPSACLPNSNHCTVDPIQYWAQQGQWPAGFQNMARKCSTPSKKRRRSSSCSESEQVTSTPRAYTQAYENTLLEHRVYMEESMGRALVQQESQNFCKQMRLKKYNEPQYTTFPLASFSSAWELLRNRNEARIYRDLTPLLVPSPELLSLRGEPGLDLLVEEIHAEWQCKPLAGPRPKPDLAIGLLECAFSEEEKAKLNNYSSVERPVRFTNNLLFPFLLCEAKSGDQAINRADRQNAHSASIAVHAIVQLHRALGEGEAKALSGRILVFSISHDNERVKIYGHFAVITDEQTSFYRYPIASFILNFEDVPGRKETYDFVRGVYDYFFPKHLELIRNALKLINEPRARSVTPESGQAETSLAQENDVFQMPSTPAPQHQLEELTLLREQLERQEKQGHEQMAHMEQIYKEQMMRQAEQYEALIAQQKKQMAQQEKQMAQQEKQMAQQEKQMAQQEKQMAQQEKQDREQIDLLKQLIGSK